MDDPEEHALVVKALRDGLGNCVVWHEKGVKLARDDGTLQGATPEWILREVIRLARTTPDPASLVRQVPERREGWRDQYRFYYKVILPVQGLKHGLFVEMRLRDDDPEFPKVTLVRAHIQKN
jgi:hypothetical protein